MNADSERLHADLTAAGWIVEYMTPFTTLVGPFWGKQDPSAQVCGFLIEQQHLDPHGKLDRGALLTFADHAIGIPGALLFPNAAMVTLELNTMFLGDAVAGDFIEGRSEVIHVDESFIFVRGTIRAGDRLIASCEGVWKRVKPIA